MLRFVACLFVTLCYLRLGRLCETGKPWLLVPKGGAGGPLPKTISVCAAEVPTPNTAQIRSGFLNTELWSGLQPQQWIERESAGAKDTGLPLTISLGYSAADIASLAPRVRPFADAPELSAHYIREDPKPMVEAIRAAKQAVDVPMLVKLSLLSREVVAPGQAAQEAGAARLPLINSLSAYSHSDRRKYV